jgi:hypothetical protein
MPEAIAGAVRALQEDAHFVQEACVSIFNIMQHSFYEPALAHQADAFAFDYHHFDMRDGAYHYTKEDVREATNKHLAIFSPTENLQDSHAVGIKTVMQRCMEDWSSCALSAAAIKCATQGERCDDAEIVDAANSYLQHINSIETNKPIVKLNYWANPNIVRFNGAKEDCSRLKFRDMYYAHEPGFYPDWVQHWRLPTVSEIDRLGVVFQESPVLAEAGADIDGWSFEDGVTTAHDIFWFQDRTACPPTSQESGGHGLRADGAGIAIVHGDGSVGYVCLDYNEWKNAIGIKRNNLQHGPQAKTMCIPSQGPYFDNDVSTLYPGKADTE